MKIPGAIQVQAAAVTRNGYGPKSCIRVGVVGHYNVSEADPAGVSDTRETFRP